MKKYKISIIALSIILIVSILINIYILSSSYDITINNTRYSQRLIDYFIGKN